MSKQLIFNFPFKKNYLEQDFYVSKNNFNAFKLIESWPKWPSRLVNIFGPKGCGKTHLINILKIKIDSIVVLSKNISRDILKDYKTRECLVIDDFNNDIDEKTLYSIINQAYQDNKYLIISSINSIKNIQTKIKDLESRFSSFVDIGIDLPTDELIRVILTKNFSDKQIQVSEKNIEYILKNIERSYEKMFKFLKDVDELSLSTGKSININLIKKILKQ